MVQVTVQNTLGAVQIGTTLAVFLFGLVTLQYHHYSQLFEDDRRAFKLLVSGSRFLPVQTVNMLQAGIVWCANYNKLTIGSANLGLLGSSNSCIRYALLGKRIGGQLFSMEICWRTSDIRSWELLRC